MHLIYRGELGVAEQLIEEAETIRGATHRRAIVSTSVVLAAWRGDRETTNKLHMRAVEAASAVGEGVAIEVAEWATAVLHNGLGEYGDAAAAAQRAYDLDVLGFSGRVLPELIEAAVRSGDRPRAERAFEQLAERSRTSTREWARGVEASGRALLSEGSDAEAHYLEALEHLGRSRVLVLHARAQLTYGEWLRREGRRVDARIQLKAALDAFETMGAAASRTALAVSCWPPARRSASEPTTRAATSRRRRRRSHASPPIGSPTPRSRRSSISARAPSSTTCARCFRSSASPHAASSPPPCRLPRTS